MNGDVKSILMDKKGGLASVLRFGHGGENALAGRKDSEELVYLPSLWENTIYFWCDEGDIHWK